MTTLSIVVPAWNAADDLQRCLASLVTTDRDIEIIVVDDGSADATGLLADAWAARDPHLVRVVHQANRGHGGAVDAGIAVARGRFVKIVDSDDELDPDAYAALRAHLRALADQDVDVVVSNFVYEKVGRRRHRTVRYRGLLPRGRVVEWHEIGRFAPWQYLLMHALVYRTDLLRECGLRLPEHTFYVDNLYAFVPLSRARRLSYLDVDLYRYRIGREGQSVQESVMFRRMDQYLRVARLMVEHLATAQREGAMPAALDRYLVHFAGIVCASASALLLREGSAASRAAHAALWEQIGREHPHLCRRLRRGALGRLATLPGRGGRTVTVLVYRAAQWAVGFN